MLSLKSLIFLLHLNFGFSYHLHPIEKLMMTNPDSEMSTTATFKKEKPLKFREWQMILLANFFQNKDIEPSAQTGLLEKVCEELIPNFKCVLFDFGKNIAFATKQGIIYVSFDKAGKEKMLKPNALKSFMTKFLHQRYHASNSVLVDIPEPFTPEFEEKAGLYHQIEYEKKKFQKKAAQAVGWFMVAATSISISQMFLGGGHHAMQMEMSHAVDQMSQMAPSSHEMIHHSAPWRTFAKRTLNSVGFVAGMASMWSIMTTFHRPFDPNSPH